MSPEPKDIPNTPVIDKLRSCSVLYTLKNKYLKWKYSCRVRQVRLDCHLLFFCQKRKQLLAIPKEV